MTTQKTTIEPSKLLEMPLTELIMLANKARQEAVGNEFDLCSIINAKSGKCAQDCKFCAQSAKHHADVSVYPLKSTDEIVEAAKQAKNIGAKKFGIVTSGNRLTDKELETIAAAISKIKNEVKIEPCASLGALSKEQLLRLKHAGLSRYHHNIETSQRFYPQIVSTHKFEERVNTVKTAKQIGLEICSGGIIGIGENWADRIEMALLLKQLNVDSVPINFLVPIKGTALQSAKQIDCVDAIRTIAIFRLILKNIPIKIAAGRETVLKGFQAMAMCAGANGMLIGGYLTVKGRSVAEDHRLVEEVEKLWNQ
ncbi:MAG: biotin synthase BioB [Planctomycetota bacterium]|jgi:biotin synthase